LTSPRLHAILAGKPDLLKESKEIWHRSNEIVRSEVRSFGSRCGRRVCPADASAAQGRPLIYAGRDLVVEVEGDTGRTAAFILPILVRLRRGRTGIKAVVATSSAEDSRKVEREFSVSAACRRAGARSYSRWARRKGTGASTAACPSSRTCSSAPPAGSSTISGGETWISRSCRAWSSTARSRNPGLPTT